MCKLCVVSLLLKRKGIIKNLVVSDDSSKYVFFSYSFSVVVIIFLAIGYTDYFLRKIYSDEESLEQMSCLAVDQYVK